MKPKEVLVDEYKGLQKHLEALNSPVVFCHDDLLAANIIYNEEKGNFIITMCFGKIKQVGEYETCSNYFDF